VIKKKEMASLKEIEEYGKIVEYNSYKGEFRDIFTAKDFEPVPLSLSSVAFASVEYRVELLLSMARYCNCTCQWVLTAENIGQIYRDDDKILRTKITLIDKKDIFYYLVGNFIQHKGWDISIIWKLENLYKCGSYKTKGVPGEYNFEKGSEFDLLLEKLITESPCFRRYLAYNSRGWTSLRIAELCLEHEAKDVDYSSMILKIDMPRTEIKKEPRFVSVLEKLKKWPYYRINCLMGITPIPCTIANRILFVDKVNNKQYQSYLEHMLNPRFAIVPIDWKCKRLFFVAKYKPNANCPFSNVPIDILKYILHFAEIVSLPKAVDYAFTEEERNKIKASQPLTWSEKFKKYFYK